MTYNVFSGTLNLTQSIQFAPLILLHSDPPSRTIGIRDAHDVIKLDAKAQDITSLLGVGLLYLQWRLRGAIDITIDVCPLMNSVFGHVNKKYVLWNVYLPNVVVFHTPLSK